MFYKYDGVINLLEGNKQSKSVSNGFVARARKQSITSTLATNIGYSIAALQMKKKECKHSENINGVII